MKQYLVCVALFSALFVIAVRPAPLHAQDLAVGIRAGSMGPGVELTGALSNKINLRAGANAYSYSRSDDIDDEEIRIRADSDLSLGSARALVDFFPVRRGVRLTAGLVYNNNHVTSTILPLESYTLNEKEFAPEKIGSLTAEVSHKASINPYVGVGFGNSVRPGGKLAFVFDLGILYTDSPAVSMEGTGMIAPTAGEAAELEENLSGIVLYPLVSVGVSYKFMGR
ncbi:MAG: hypothetical protein WD423_12815 [Rhodothermales bacterium]